MLKDEKELAETSFYEFYNLLNFKPLSFWLKYNLSDSFENWQVDREDEDTLLRSHCFYVFNLKGFE